MRPESSLDGQLLSRLPLPLAALYARAHNAKTPLERHQSAYYLFEAALKLLGAVAVAEYAARPDNDPGLAERLKNLARPAVGHWREFVRLLVPVLAAGDTRFAAVRDLLSGRTRDDLPRAARLDELLADALGGRSGGGRGTVRLGDLFDRLVAYRNKHLGHGVVGVHPAGSSYYERMARVMTDGVAELLGRLDALAGRRLTFVDAVHRRPDGSWQADRYLLTGLVAERIDPLGLSEADAAALPRPERLYLEAAGADGRPPRLTPLHPLAVYDPECGEVLFLNARRGKARIEYLSYTTGRVIERSEVAAAQRELLARVLELPVGDVAIDDWAARARAEEDATPVAPPRDPAPRRLGEFELLSKLGQGGMGAVYRAWQPSLDREVAVKCLTRLGDPKAEARFGREIRALARVEHPNLVKVFSSGTDGDQWFYAMELVEGPTLAAVSDGLRAANPDPRSVDGKAWAESVASAWSAARSAEPTAPPGDPAPPPTVPAAIDRGYIAHVAELVRQVAEAAHALHEAGVVHRDIKPGNVLLADGGRQAVLADLGLAQITDEVAGRLTRTRQFVGTLRYASPEQVLAVARVDRRSDVYSLGATLWELLTLRPLYAATDDTPTPDLMQRIQYEEPERPRRHHPGVPRDLEAVALKCLEKNPARRYPTAQELAADLGRFLGGEPVHAHPPTLRYVLGKYARRYRGRVAAAAVAMAVLVGGTVAAFLAIDAQRRRAEQNAIRAEDNFQAALAAANALVERVAVELKPIAGAKRSTVARILDEARAVYDRLPPDTQDRTEVLEAKARMLTLFSEVYRDLGDTGKSLAAAEQAQEHYRRLRERDAGHAGWRVGMARALQQAGVARVYRADSTGALADLRASLALREELLAEAPDDPDRQSGYAAGQSWTAVALNNRGEAARAKPLFLRALDTCKRLADGHPARSAWQRDLTLAHRNVGMVLGDEGELDGAIEEHSRAVAIARKLTAGEPQNGEWQLLLNGCLTDLADLRLRAGDRGPAAQLLEEARKQAETFVSFDPAHDGWQVQHILARAYLADLKADPRRAAEEIRAKIAIFSEMQKLAERRVSEDPDDAFWQSRRSGAQKFQGTMHAALAPLVPADLIAVLAVAPHGMVHAALAPLVPDPRSEYRTAVALTEAAVEGYRKLADRDPDSEQWMKNLDMSLTQLAGHYSELADAEKEPAAKRRLREKSRDAELEAAWLELTFAERVAARDQGDLARQFRVARAAIRVAGVYSQYGDRGQKTAHLTRAAESLEKLASADPGNTTYLDELAAAHWYLGVAKREQEPDVAIRHYRRSADLYRRLLDRDRDNPRRQSDYLRARDHLISAVRTSDVAADLAWSLGTALPANSPAAEAWSLWEEDRPLLVQALRRRVQALFPKDKRPKHRDISESGSAGVRLYEDRTTGLGRTAIGQAESLYQGHHGRVDRAFELVRAYLNRAENLEVWKDPAAVAEGRVILRRAVCVCRRLEAEKKLLPGEAELVADLLAALKRLPPAPGTKAADAEAQKLIDELDYLALARWYVERGRADELVAVLCQDVATLLHPELEPGILFGLFQPIASDSKLYRAIDTAASKLAAKDPGALGEAGSRLIVALAEATGDPDVSIAPLQRLLAAHPGELHLRTRLYAHLSASFRYREAADEYGLMIAHPDHQATADDCLLLAGLRMGVGDTAAATAAVREAEKLAPGTAGVRLADASIAFVDRRFDRVRALLAEIAGMPRATADERRSAELLTARMEIETGEVDAAVVRARKLVKGNTSDAAGQVTLAYALATQGKDSSAATAAEAAARLLPRSPAVRFMRAWTRWLERREGGDLDLMAQVAGHETMSHDPAVFEILGDAYQAVGRTADARGAWEKALSRFPKTAAADDLRRSRLKDKLDKLP